MLQAAIKRKLASESDCVHLVRVFSLKAASNVFGSVGKGKAGGRETLGCVQVEDLPGSLVQ